FLPRGPQVRKLREYRHRQTDRNKVLTEHFVALEANVAVLKRRWIDGPFAACLGHGSFLSIPVSAAVFSALKQHHRLTRTADDGCCIDLGERCLERRQGGKRASRWRGGDLAPGPFVFAIVVGVIAVAILVVVVATHTLPPFWKALSASENIRAVSLRPRTGACTFSARTSETPERAEAINSCGILRPRAFALSSICLGERITSASMISPWSNPRLSKATCATISRRQWRWARPAESA